MKNIIFAGLIVAMTSAFTPMAASAAAFSGKHQSAAINNPLDANARMRDRSSYGSPSAGRMRTGMRHRDRYRSHRMTRGHRSMMRDASAHGTPMAKQVRQ